MSVKLGFQGVLKYKIGGISAGGSFVTLGNVRDVSPSSSYSEIDVSTRADQGTTCFCPLCSYIIYMKFLYALHNNGTEQ